MWFLLFSVEEEKPTVETGKRKGDTDDWRRNEGMKQSDMTADT